MQDKRFVELFVKGANKSTLIRSQTRNPRNAIKELKSRFGVSTILEKVKMSYTIYIFEYMWKGMFTNGWQVKQVLNCLR